MVTSVSLSENDTEPILQDDSEDEIDWEEVEVPQEQQHLEITLQARPRQDTSNKKKGVSHADRVLRIDCHKIHTVSLLANALARNKWINDPLLHARLLSLTPLPLQSSFTAIHKSRVPEQQMRGRMFEAAITRLVEWWFGSFFEVLSEGHLRNRTFDSVQSSLVSHGFSPQVGLEQTIELEALQDILDDDGEPIRSSKSFMKHALMRCGSRDVSSQLFTALCRALGIPTRLVVSLQSVPWQAGVGKPKPKYTRKAKGKGKEKEKADDDEDGDMEEVAIPRLGSAQPSSSNLRNGNKVIFPGEGEAMDSGIIEKSEKARGKEKAKPKPEIKLRKTKSKGNVLGGPSPKVAKVEPLDPTATPPVFWTEVFSRPDGRWIPVDPLRCIVNKPRVFDPSSSSTTSTQNRMVYVLAMEEDGYGRDVTRRYAKEFSAKVAKVQGGSSSAGIRGGGRGRLAWWERVVGSVSRPYRLHRDDVEDDELETAQIMEGMPTSIGGFKDHPLYVLTRHLKQPETIYPAPPATPELGKFRGEPVYPRSSVVSLKSAESWMRSSGRRVVEGNQPLKLIKMRPGTVSRMRELEVLKDGLKEAGHKSQGESAGNEVMQGLYAFSQTEVLIPDPVVNGKIPKNDFGNIDLYVPSMLPQGAVHVPFKGVVKIARKLGFDYAEAVTGFEFKKRRAFPVVEGVVVATENESALLEAYWEAEQDAEEKARIKREERVIKRWTRLIHGLRVRKRLQEQYATTSEQIPTNEEGVIAPDNNEETVEHDGLQGSGGFLVGADDVVQAYNLPRYQHIDSGPEVSTSLHRPDTTAVQDTQLVPEEPTAISYDLETMEVDSDRDAEDVVPPDVAFNVPKSMRELAEGASRVSALHVDHNENVENEVEEYLPVKHGAEISFRQATTRTKTDITTTTKRAKKASASRRQSTKKRDRDESDGSDSSRQPSPIKRNRQAVPSVPAAPTRVLRPRASKNYAQLADDGDGDED